MVFFLGDYSADPSGEAAEAVAPSSVAESDRMAVSEASPTPGTAGAPGTGTQSEGERMVADSGSSHHTPETEESLRSSVSVPRCSPPAPRGRSLAPAAENPVPVPAAPKVRLGNFPQIPLEFET